MVLAFATVPDLLRLLVVPVFGLAAWRDYRTRRVPNSTWYPLVALGAVLLVWDGWTALTGLPGQLRLYALHVALSLGVVVPIAYVFWRIGGFGGADAKALMALALLFPAYPVYYLPQVALPLVETTVGVFSLTVLTNTVLLGLLYPVLLGVRNAAAGETSTVMFVGRPVPWDEVPHTHGRLLETPQGFTRRGLDLDALRMYLRWRGVSLADLRANPELRDPDTLPSSPNDPTDGAVAADGGRRPVPEDFEWAGEGDPWGAEAFLAAIDHGAYGTKAGQLQAALDVLVEQDEVWVSPGLPFIVPMFAGLLVSLTVGDLLFGLLQLVALA